MQRRAGGSDRPEDSLADELRDKTLALVSVQRNYESISRLMQLKHQELEQAETALAAEQANTVSLGVQLEECRSRCTSLEKQLDGLKKLPPKLSELEAEHESLKRDAAQANARAMTMQEAMKGLRQSLEDEQHNSERQRQQMEAWRKADSGLGVEVRSLRQQLAESQGDCRAMSSELRALKDALARSTAAQQAEAQRAALLTAQVSGQGDTIRGLRDEVRTLTQLSHELRSAVRAGEVALAAARGTQAVLEAQLRGAQRSGEVARQLQDDLAAKLAAGEAAMAESKAAYGAKEEEMAQLRILINDLEEKYQASLSGKLAADEVSSSLQLQLAQTRGALADARRRATTAEQDAARAAAAAAAAGRDAAARASNANRLLSAMQYRASEAGGLLATRVDAVSERLVSRLEDRLGRGLAEEAERLDKAFTVTQLKLQSWEAELLDMEAQLLGVAKAVEALTAAAIRRQAEREREVNTVRGDAAALRARVEELKAALEGEMAARQLLAQSKAAVEVEHRTALQAAQVAADERVEAERQRLGARLTAVEEEVARLTSTHQRETAAAARAWEAERQQLGRRLAELSAELAKAREVKAAPLPVAGPAPIAVNTDHSNALAVLHTQLNAELQATKDQHEKELKQYKEQLDSVRTHVRGTWSICSRLATDLALVARHLTRMGVGLPEGAADLPTGLHGVADDGGGVLVEQLAAALRLGFGQLAEGVQGMVRRLQTLQAHNVELEAKAASVNPAAWAVVAAELRGTVAKLVHVEESLAPPCTCLMCLEVFKSPITLVPCGHTFCRKCLSNANGLCSECGAVTPAEVTVPNAPLDAICAKYELKRSALAAIQRALQQAGEGAAATAAGGGHGHGQGHAGCAGISGTTAAQHTRRSSERAVGGGGAAAARAIGQAAVTAAAAVVGVGGGGTAPTAAAGVLMTQGASVTAQRP
ncbi:hypothetical protein VaNZ11_001177 [Volvox africanus]|uniref:RING-type domain-containing protein n=1 Tax=Volvox africanus TaxID=51714 RepID=A0ABQ5RPH8_9CHLO|nr:hypothetical protein VaNZ11_001177 [Volvox africanus]